MNAILQFLQFVQQHKTLVTLIVGAVLGLLLGLAIGWWWWPVEWTNSTPGNLRSDFQTDYILWVAEQYATNDDAEWACAKLGVGFWKEGQLAETLDGLAQEMDGQEEVLLLALAQALEVTPTEAAPTESEPGEGTAVVQSVAMVCGSAALVLAVVVGAWIIINRLRGPSAKPEAVGRGVGIAGEFPPSERASWGDKGPPLAQFVTTYAVGDDHYDPSFSIEMESGEFMGECGVGISETIGVGEPNKVTAFEVWLFDKNDIRTVTTVLMSEYAFYDEAMRAKLAPKGEPLLAEVGKDLILKTKTLHVRARIVEAGYGMGNLPPNSFFERLTIDLAAWVKPVQEREQPTAGSDAPVMLPTL